MILTLSQLIKAKQKGMSSAHIKLATNGVLRVRCCMETSLRRKAIKDSFTTMGTFDKHTRRTSLERVLTKCSSHIPDELKLVICRSLGKLSRLMQTQGELFDKDFDSVQIPGSKKDNLVLYRRRFVILTCKAVISAQCQAKEEKLAKNLAKKSKHGVDKSPASTPT